MTDPKLEQHIEPCPWCGGEGETGGLLPWVECVSCDASGPSCGTEAEAIAAWNRVAALSQQRAVPEGYALVPVEPTAAMVNAAANYDTGSSDGTVGRFCAGEIWYLMLAAAPSPEQENGNG